jgi:molecular chaperone DnaJ
VSKDASEDDIKKAFRKLSLQYHPDRHTNDSEEDKKAAEEKFVEVNEAYSILSDKSLRETYDNGPQVDDFFNPFGGGMQTPQGGGVIVTVWVTYEDILNGIKDRPIKYRRMVRCPECGGEGGKDVNTCSHCHGTGRIVNVEQRAGFTWRQETTCPYCHGQGKTVGTVCNHCHGAGLVSKEETFNFTANTEHLIQNHGRLYVGQMGSESKDKNGIDGELIFEIRHKLPDNKRIIPTEYGWSVIEYIKIPYYDMLLGTKLIVEAPTGKKLSVNVPECSEDNKQLRLRGQGFTIPDAGTGDYIVILNMDLPDKLNKNEKELIEKIKSLKNTA